MKVPNLTIIPAQRYVAEVRFDTPGVEGSSTHAILGLNNFQGEFFSQVDTVGTITVARGAGEGLISSLARASGWFGNRFFTSP